MNREYPRRDFNRLALAAAAGIATGVANPLAGQEPRSPAALPSPDAKPSPDGKPPADAKAEKKAKLKFVVEDYKPADSTPRQVEAKKRAVNPVEIHVCRGLNACKNRGRMAKNQCAGRGDCATTPGSPHECTTLNHCRGQGGCRTTAGRNACQGLGEGAVPILEEEWVALRERFERKMKLLRKKVGAAPPSDSEERWERNWQDRVAQALREQEEEDRKAKEEGRPPARGATRKVEAAGGPATRPTQRPGGMKEQEGKSLLDELTEGEKKP